MTPVRPSQWQRRLLEGALPSTLAGRSIAGDVLEEYHARAPGIRREIWLSRVTLTLFLAYLPVRLRATRPFAAGLRALRDDVRSGARALRRDRGTAAIAVVTLAVGIGSVTAILSVLYGSLFRPLPFHDPDRVLLIGDRSVEMPPDQVAGNIALTNVRDLAARSSSLEGLAAYRDAEVTLAGRGDAARVRAQEVDAGFFEVLGVRTIAGRPITAADQTPGATPVVIIGERLWRQQFGADPAAIGSVARIDGMSRTIVGIAPAITQLGNPELWLPLVPNARGLLRIARQVYAVARLRDDVELPAARAEMIARFDDLRREFPEIGARRSVGAMTIEDWLIGPAGRSLLWLLAGAVTLVLVVACVNVTNLLLVRAERRQGDLAVRAALGATRSRLLRELAAEAVLLALAGAALGALFAAWSIGLLVDLYGAVLPRSWEISLHPGVLFVTCGIAVVVGLLVVILPAHRLPGGVINRAQGDARGYSGASRAQRALVAVEAAIAMLLLALAGLLVNTVARLSSEDLGIRPDHAVLFDVSFAGRFASPDAGLSFVSSLTTRLRALPAVTHAAAASRRPLFGGNNGGFETDTGGSLGIVEVREVTANYFDALGIPTRGGRALAPADAAQPVAVVNRAFERAHSATRSILGTRFRAVGSTDGAFEIVGIVEDVREFGPAAAPRPTAYFPYGRGPYGMSTVPTFIVRVASGDPMAVVPPARAVVHELDADVALDDPITLAAQAASRIGRDRLAIRALLSLAGALSLGLTIVGIYGVTAYAVARRTREIGIRRALGASRRGVVLLLVRQGSAMALPGLALGVIAAVAGGRLVASYLHGVDPADPLTIGAAALVCLVAVLTACWLPARKASRIEALQALRS
jgi:putative ABC transport system permease protein